MLAPLPVAGETGVAPAAAAILPITLYTDFENEPAQPILAALEDELASIMTPIGIRFEWRNLDHHPPGEATAELAVVTVKGRCDTNGLLPKTKLAGALGFTHISDGQILPFTEISCDQVRTFLQNELSGMDRQDRDFAFGRALGRVLAHELYHILGNTTHHGSGVAKEAYSTRDLMRDDFQFPHKEIEMLRAGRVHNPPPAAPATKAAGTFRYNPGW
jgi:hypothetical protein